MKKDGNKFQPLTKNAMIVKKTYGNDNRNYDDDFCKDFN